MDRQNHDVSAINNMLEKEFILLVLKMVIEIRMNGDNYNKYDIENGILSRLQNCSDLSSSKYNIISRLRNIMWYDNKSIISYDELWNRFMCQGP